jgi:hypothetical protein
MNRRRISGLPHAPWPVLVLAAMIAAGSGGCDPAPTSGTSDPAGPAATSPNPTVHPSPAEAQPESPSRSGTVRRPPSERPGGDPASEGQHRRIGPGDRGREITIRYGGRLDVAPGHRPGGWRVANYPRSILRLLGSPAPADGHTFTATAVGEGQIILTAGTGPANTFTVRVRIMRDMTRHPQP